MLYLPGIAIVAYLHTGSCCWRGPTPKTKARGENDARVKRGGVREQGHDFAMVLQFTDEIGVYIGLIVLTLGISAVMSGLSLGLMTLNVRELQEIIDSSTDQKEVANAKIVLPIREWDIKLLCALVLATTLVDVMSTLFIDAMFANDGFLSELELVVAVLISTISIFLFASIIPMAICTAYALQIGAACASLVWPMLYFFLPISYPIDKLFGPFLKEGDDGTLPGPFAGSLKLATKSMVSVRSVKAVNSLSTKAASMRSVKSIQSSKSVRSRRHTQAAPFVDSVLSNVMRPWPWSECFTLAEDTILDEDTLAFVQECAQDFIPVDSEVEPGQIVAILAASDLIGIQPPTQLKDLLATNSA